MFSDAGAFDEGLLFLQLGQAILTETEKTKLEVVTLANESTCVPKSRY